MKKYAIELICLVLFLLIVGSGVYHCSTRGTGARAATVADASTTDWVLVLQIVSGIIVAAIGAAPSLIKAFREGNNKAIKDETDELSKKIDDLSNKAV